MKKYLSYSCLVIVLLSVLVGARGKLRSMVKITDVVGEVSDTITDDEGGVDDNEENLIAWYFLILGQTGQHYLFPE